MPSVIDGERGGSMLSRYLKPHFLWQLKKVSISEGLKICWLDKQRTSLTTAVVVYSQFCLYKTNIVVNFILIKAL